VKPYSKGIKLGTQHLDAGEGVTLRPPEFTGELLNFIDFTGLVMCFLNSHICYISVFEEIYKI
jgi:hypothetical protein